MKDFDRNALESSRPVGDALGLISFCLDAIYDDGVHMLQDSVVSGLTFEELIGALLLARDELQE